MIAVIGDIHGCYLTLRDLYTKLSEITNEIYTVGDLVDRGNYSKEVIQFCIDYNIKPVLGNHDDLFTRAIGLKPFNGNSREYWIRNHVLNGGEKTYQSYNPGFSTQNLDSVAEAVKLLGHDKFLLSMPLQYEITNLVITHAGISRFSNETLWHREKLEKLKKLQVIGHTPHQRYIYKSGWFVNVDTGCVFGGKLTAAIIDEVKGTALNFVQVKFRKEDTENVIW
ncbi:MAG: metallophosphoesterase [Ignavibacteriaceae bacterium]|jgi:Calcineurin-like phosphoesterase.|nr:MAG: hypothetical protein EDM69_07175 [Chlorobiota bacterium]KXK06198.1 MAG: metallophosphoesterase [Chlorobi bacterium OLB4]MBV6399288.1 Bis(5'-nucleosyl)-tetraphosphatase, symmetrical [Ignavibacteria bacterium]MCC6884961.1 metallophosphoesterase [Ignavibacteriales bacterium]MCE7953508.1 hypothetical protein [Chlorobi bacterium CHB7]MDL1887602.1 hypothetical protein [Ignavibacteria bacterium CHB1]MEB2329270.1 metallophosphoesterase [Ignavibacteriaceae bacterium]OQY78487.1 MAG: hypothetic